MTTITGNLLDITEGTICHQTNCRGATGGLAGALRRKYPRAFIDYCMMCDKYGDGIAGMALLSNVTPSLSILHLFGQIAPGPNTDIDLVREALRHAKLKRLPQPVYTPFKIGCGLGGGYWPDYLAELEAAFPGIVIVQRVEDAEPARVEVAP